MEDSTIENSFLFSAQQLKGHFCLIQQSLNKYFPFNNVAIYAIFKN